MIGKLGEFAIHHTGCFGLRMTVTIGCTAGIIALVSGGGVSAGGAKAEPAGESAKQLVDVVAGTLFDGWGKAAVQTLSMYYAPDTAQSAVEMLGYQASFLPVFDWANGAIDNAASASDLYGFYATGAGAGRVQNASDPSYAFSYATRYREPKGRVMPPAYRPSSPPIPSRPKTRLTAPSPPTPSTSPIQAGE